MHFGLNAVLVSKGYTTTVAQIYLSSHIVTPFRDTTSDLALDVTPLKAVFCVGLMLVMVFMPAILSILLLHLMVALAHAGVKLLSEPSPAALSQQTSVT
jgi:hypothetical protein